MDVVMCACISESVPVCKRCQVNYYHLESFTQNSNDFLYLKYIFPELNVDTVDLAELTGAVDVYSKMIHCWMEI
jgi:hypothetical protein